MKHSTSKKPQHRMFTVTGKPVYSNGRGLYSLEKSGQLQASTIDPITTENALYRLSKAAVQVGEQCEWRYDKDIDVISVYI